MPYSKQSRRLSLVMGAGIVCIIVIPMLIQKYIRDFDERTTIQISKPQVAELEWNGVPTDFTKRPLNERCNTLIVVDDNSNGTDLSYLESEEFLRYAKSGMQLLKFHSTDEAESSEYEVRTTMWVEFISQFPPLAEPYVVFLDDSGHPHVLPMPEFMGPTNVDEIATFRRKLLDLIRKESEGEE